MRAFKLTADGDYDLSSGNLQIVEDGVALVQRLTLTLNVAWGEWFANHRFGVDYFGSVLGMKPEHVREEAFRRAILADTEITDIYEMAVTDDNTGVLTVEFAANSIYGEQSASLGVAV